MGNMRRLAEGQDFDHTMFAQEKDFGFTGSAQGYDEHPASPPFAASKPDTNPGHHEVEPYAHGGHHMHPHGHHVVRVEHHPHTGAVIHHHAHGGHTIHHPDGHVSHHDHMGRPLHHAMGGQHGEEGHDGTHVGKLMAAKAVHQHEDHEHQGEHTDLNLARGGHANAGHPPRIPRSMRPKADSEHSPINTPPRNPMRSATARNQMPGGQMPYGVEPSSEPDEAGDGQGIPQLGKGGHHKSHGGKC